MQVSTMNLGQAHTQAATSHQPPGQAETRLHGYWLVLARMAWVVVLVLALGIFIVNIPFNFADAHIICTAAVCSVNGGLTLARVHELQHLGLSLDFYALMGIVLSAVLEAGYVVTGVVIFCRKSDDRMALITSFALVTFGSVFHNPIPLTTQPPLLQSMTLWMAFLGGACLGLFFYMFPTAQFAPRWVGFLALAWIAYWGFHDLVIVSYFSQPGLDITVFLSLLASVAVVQMYRYRRLSTSAQRQQTKWVIFGLSVAMLGSLVLLAVQASFSLGIIAGLFLGSLLYFSLLFIPLSVGMAILRSRLYDIDIIINRTLVYGTLTASIVGIYVLVVVSLGALLQTSSNLLISLLATGLVAVLFQPLRLRLQRAANHLMFGERDTPYTVISRLGQRLEATLAPDAVLPTLVETVAQALKLPHAAITLKQGGEYVTAASYGSPQETLTRLPLIYQTEQIGELLLAPRGSGETFTSADRALLNDLARQAGVAAHAVRLTTDLQRLTGELQRSRTQLVTAREEERRRLRRDLHDGLGSALTSVTFQLDAASNLLDRDPQAVKNLLKELKAQTQASIADIRRLVYNLRPPILDEWGLVAALREQVAQYQLHNVQVTVDAPESLSALPAAVEVAAYRITLEALANVVRHAQASTCTIRLSIGDDALMVEVHDDGSGLSRSFHAGVGINAMRERAAELGGSCAVETVATGGTHVSASLPLMKE
jgi:signal transduction histidine kinase